MTVDKSDTCLEMVLNGLGYAIIPGYVLKEDNRDIFTMELTDKNGKPIVRDTWMFYHEESMHLKLVEAFVEFVGRIDFEKL
jgi:DNA-binding transcriptional LysR family regulator